MVPVGVTSLLCAFVRRQYSRWEAKSETDALDRRQRGIPDLAENGQALVAGALSLSAFAIGGVAFSLLGNPVLPFAILLALLLFALVVIMGLATRVGIPQDSEDRTVDLETAVYTMTRIPPEPSPARGSRTLSKVAPNFPGNSGRQAAWTAN